MVTRRTLESAPVRAGGGVVRRLMLASLVSLCSACLTLFQPSEVKHLYTLDGETRGPATPPGERGGPVLQVSIPRAEAGYDTVRMAYMTRPHTLSYYSKSQWAATPARMLAGALVARLQATGRFAAVALPPTFVAPEYRLDGEGLVLVQEYFVKPSRVRLGVRLQLVEVRSQRILSTREIVVTEPAASNNAAGGATAANHAATRLLDEAAEWVTQTIQAQQPPAALVE